MYLPLVILCIDLRRSLDKEQKNPEFCKHISLLIYVQVILVSYFFYYSVSFQMMLVVATGTFS